MKKVDMLQDPSAYLEQRNNALLKAGTSTATSYANSLDHVVRAVTGKTNKKSAPECRKGSTLGLQERRCTIIVS